jgi:hypothetical protein
MVMNPPLRCYCDAESAGLRTTLLFPPSGSAQAPCFPKAARTHLSCTSIMHVLSEYPQSDKIVYVRTT